jgi:hypothetical protein
VTAAAILAVATLVQMRRPRPGFLGWCPGFAAGSALTQLVFVPESDPTKTSQTWVGLVLLLMVLWALALAAVALRRRQSGRGSRRAEGN